jgi:twitching motility protein PilT
MLCGEGVCRRHAPDHGGAIVSEYTPTAGTTPDAGYEVPSPRAAEPAGRHGAHVQAQPYVPTFMPVEDEAPAYPPPPSAAAPAPVPTPPPAAATVAEPSRLGIDDTAGQGLQLVDLLEALLACGGSDLHLTAGAPPTVRLHGVMRPIEDTPKLVPADLQRMIYQVISQKQRERFEENLELDFAYPLPGRGRFRVNVYRQRDSIGAVFRMIPSDIKPLEDLGLPPQIGNFAALSRGFVLVTGPTGSGKSTTLASIVDLANRTRNDHIMTVEDPIEFLHRHQSCIVNQREVGEDTLSFTNALKHALRQDPDIILVGELRDLETISIALTAAETGHLVFGTLHTQDAAQSVDRIIDVFPPHQQQQIRVMLAGALQGIVCQTLVKTADGRGRVVASEVMIATAAVRNLIREGKTHQIYSAMQAGAEHGMVTMDQSLATLVRRGWVSYENALEKCHHVPDFTRLCGRI